VYARANLRVGNYKVFFSCRVLAPVDSHVARHVFDNVIGPQGLLATKARILVTNSIAYLKHFDQLAYIQRGIILECGSYQQLVSNPDSAVRKLIQNHAANASSSGETHGAETLAHTSGSGVRTPTTNDMQTVLIDEMDLVVSEICQVLSEMLYKLQNIDRAYIVEKLSQRNVLLKLYINHAISRHPLVSRTSTRRCQRE